MNIFSRRRFGFNNPVDRSYVLYDGEGRVIPKYSEINKLGENLFRVKKDGLYGLVDQEDNLLLPCVYQEIRSFVEGMARVKREDKYGFINEMYIETIPCEFLNANDFRNGLAKVCNLPTSTKFIDAYKKTRVDIAHPFDEVSDVIGGLIQVRGIYASTFVTDNNEPFEDGKKFYEVTEDGKYWFGETDYAKFRFDKKGRVPTWERDEVDSYSDYLRQH